ncbi:MAG: PEP-utilizing enzyme [Candidatus Paceibacterota bacterium]|jgi:phosphoenolpyruvate synthase/pyruvate phosphate dikinase
MPEKKYKPEDWIMVRTRYIPALFPLSAYFSWPLGEYLKIKRGISLEIWENGHFTAVVEKEFSKDRNEGAFKILWENKDNLEKIRKEGIEAGQKAVDLCKEFADTCVNRDIESFPDFFDKFIITYQELMRKNMILWLFGGAEAERQLLNHLKEYGIDEAHKILPIMVSHQEKSYSQIEEEEFKNLLKIAKSNGLENINTKEAIKIFSDKYFWFPYEYVGPIVWTEETVSKRVEETLVSKEYNKTSQNIDIVLLQEEYQEKYKFSEETNYLFKIMRNLSLMQDDRKMLSAQICYYFNDIILKWAASKLNLTLDEARYLDPRLARLAISGKDISINIKNRMDIVIETNSDKGSTYHEGSNARKLLIKLNVPWKTDHKDIKEIHGQVANKGKVVGKVRVLKSSHVNNFDNGDIIVTGMTTPDFAPLIKRAGGIITDEGGITCHAAIISRELNIPCIIGTKIATKVLKDGDKVELDAEKGIIRII